MKLSLRICIIASVVLAVLGFLFGPLRWFIFAGSNDVPNAGALSLSVWLGWLWLASFAFTLFLHHLRAMWLVLAAPFTLYWPAMWIFVGHVCSLAGKCG